MRPIIFFESAVAILVVMAGNAARATAPDLVVSNVAVLSPAVSGQPVSLSWTVFNQGDGPAIGNWVDRLYLCTSPTLNSSITYWYWNGSGPVAAGASYTNNTCAG